MKRLLLVVVLIVIFAAGVFLSMVRVPADGGAWCAGSYLGPGLHFRAPWKAVHRYPVGEQSVEVVRDITGREGAREQFTVTLRYSWDMERLPGAPVDPEALPAAIEKKLGSLDGKFSGATIGRQVNAALPGLLSELPITVVEVRATYPRMAFEELAAAARPTGERVVLVGLDGLDWVLLNRLIAEGRCPTFARMKRRGAWADLVSHKPVLSPLIWTSMATGRLPEDHGILDFVVKDPKTGKDIPITNQFRKVHAFWNILSYIDTPVNVVNWWATYPAEPLDGIMVSERLFYQLFGIRPPLDDPANVYPPEVLQEILPLLVSANDIDYDEVRHYAGISRAEYDLHVKEAAQAENPFEDRINHLRKILAVTHGVFNIGRWMLENHPARVLALYIEGTDTIGHRFAHFLPPKLSWVSEADYRRYHDTMARYYELVDRELGRLMKKAPADTTWIITADHGFFTGAARPHVLPDDFAIGAAQWHRMVGVFMAQGPHVRRGKIPHADIYDLCRTLLWLEGAPISRQLKGHALVDMMRRDWVRAHPPVYVDSYEKLPRTWEAEGARSIMDEARLKELQALGYLSAAGESAAKQPKGEQPSGGTQVPAASAEARRGGGTGGLEVKPTELYNRAKLAEERGDLEKARKLYLKTLELEPEFAFAMINLARLEERLGDGDQAMTWITRALKVPRSQLPSSTLVEYVRLAAAVGRANEALDALGDLKARWGQTADFAAAQGLALQKLGRDQEALTAYEVALARDPGNSSATEGLLGLAERGLPVDVNAVLEAHYNAVKGELKRLNAFSVICLRHRQAAWAEKALGTLLASDPTNAGLLSNMAAVLQQQGKLQEAEKMLERATAARPGDGSLRYNHGATLAALGRLDEALLEFQEAARLGKPGPRVYAAQAKMLVQLGRIDEAKKALQEGLQKNPGNAQLQDLANALAE